MLSTLSKPAFHLAEFIIDQQNRRVLGAWIAILLSMQMFCDASRGIHRILPRGQPKFASFIANLKEEQRIPEA